LSISRPGIFSWKTPMNLLQEIAQQNLPDVIGAVERWVRGDEATWRYARCIEDWGPDFEMYRKRWSVGGFDLPNIARSAAMHELRRSFIRRFGFMLPCAELLDELQKADLVVEVGAGSGYMTRIMRHRGIEVIGSDPGIGYFETHGAYDAHQVVAQGKTMVRRHPDALIFCSWPSLGETWFRQMLRAMRVGQRIVTVLEDSCCEDTAREYFDACFDTERTIDIPAFEHMNDVAYVATKKRNR
jgi:hypothetical protein